MLRRCVLTARNYMKHVLRLHLFIYFSYSMITGSVIFYLHTDNQIRVLYIIGLQIGISLLFPRAGGGGYLFLRILASCFIFIIFFYKMLAVDSWQPLLTRISLDSRDSRQNFAENLLRFVMYNAEFRTLYRILFSPEVYHCNDPIQFLSRGWTTSILRLYP